MRKGKLKDTKVMLAVTLFAILFTVAGYRICAFTSDEADDADFYTAKILSVGEPQTERIEIGEGVEPFENQWIPFTAEFTGGPEKGRTFEAIQYIDSLYAIPPREVEAGHHILVTSNEGEADGGGWVYVEHNRGRYLIGLSLVFLLLVVLVGKFKGLATILSLATTAAAIFVIYIPSILKGYNIYLTTSILSVYIIVVSLIMMNGSNIKTYSAILGNVGGVAASGLLAFFMNGLLHVTGFIDEDYALLLSMDSAAPIDLRAGIWGSIVIGSLGAIMDIAMTIASAMNEVAEHMGEKSFRKLLRSGMNIGVDSIGTMTNTLVLAYIGGALAMVLLLVAYNKNVLFLFNLEMIVVEVAQAVIGSMGILLAVPATALISAYLHTIKPPEQLWGEGNE